MKLGTKIVGITVAATALCGVGIGTASAATPTVAAHHSSVSGKTDGPTRVVAYQASLDMWQSVTLPAFACPADQPWLVNTELVHNRVVPNGVIVDEPGGVGVTILEAAPGPDGLASGWRSGSGTATNWGTRNTVTISAVCTSTAADAYPA
ncbi:MAG TPA: hypothetical protein VIT41_10560 [Microlunatus sp.]